MPSRLLTKREKELLKYLGEIIDFGSSLVSAFDMGKMPPKESYLLTVFGAVNNYSEAIYVLCKDSRPQAAQVLLRPLVEAFINTFYLLSTRSGKRLALFAAEAAREKTRVANSMLDFLKRYPQWKNKSKLTTKKDLSLLIKQNQQEITNIRKNYKIRQDIQFPDLLERAREGDKKKPIKLRKGDIEYNYHLVYRYLSPLSHLNAAALGGRYFLKPDSKGGYYLDMGQSRGVEPVLASTYAYYLYFLEYLKKKKVISQRASLTKFRKIMRSKIAKAKSKP